MALFEKLVPSQLDYYKRFNTLDETDLEIISAMVEECPNGPRNVSKIARKLGLPQQTVNYRVLRFEHLDLVRFAAILDEALIGLANYAVITTVKPGLLFETKQGSALNAGTFLTCYPVWRQLQEVQGGTTRGFFVSYAIPPDKENDLKSFLTELQRIGIIERVEDFCRITRSYHNLPLRLYLKIRKIVSQHRSIITFNWKDWAHDFDKADENLLVEETIPSRRFAFSYEDLVVLSHLEKNLRERFIDIGRSIRKQSKKIAEIYRKILHYGLIKGCRVELYPLDPVSSLHLVLQLSLASLVALRKLVAHLNEIPYHIVYHKVLGKNELFLNAMIPAAEYFDFINALEEWGRRGDIIRGYKLYISNYYSKFTNINLYEAFSKKENKWTFSQDVMSRSLRSLLDSTKFKF